MYEIMVETTLVTNESHRVASSEQRNNTPPKVAIPTLACHTYKWDHTV